MTQEQKRILVIDNDYLFSESIKVFFEERGYSIRTCQEAEDSLSVFSEFKPDVVILDLKISTEDGLAILKRIRSQNKDVKVIIVTGSIDSRKIDEAQESGADECMIKPVSMADLKGIIDKL